MPAGVNPPRGAIAASTLTVLQSGSTTYNAGTGQITNGGVNYYLCLERGPTPDECQWFYATDSECSAKKNPYCTMSQTTYNVVHSGTYNNNQQTFTYSGLTYEIRFIYEGGNKALAVKI